MLSEVADPRYNSREKVIHDTAVDHHFRARPFRLVGRPEVPGAFSQGKTREEARENVLDALIELMTARRELALRDRSPGAELENLPMSASAP